MTRFLICLPWILLIVVPFLVAACKASKAERKYREQQAAQAAAAEQRRIEAERKRAEQAAKAAERGRARAAKEAERQRKQDARLEAARLRAEYAERELAAKREAKALDRERHEIISAKDERPSEPVKQDEPAEIVQDTRSEPEQPKASDHKPSVKGNNAFKGHVVAFTGKLPGMTRSEAIQAVQDNGGRAYTKMPVGTTLLVVGDNPGMCKMDKADEWIGQVRKITAAQFFAMLDEPLTIEADEFAAWLAAQCA